MLDQDFVLALLQASIAGAGLVLAVYALIIPLSRKYFSYRAEEIYDKLQELKATIRTTDTSVTSEQLSSLKTILESIEEREAFPTYLGWGAGIVFFGYVACALMSVNWIFNRGEPNFEWWLGFTFVVSTILFLLVGLFSIKDISKTMKREFEDLKKNIEQAKSKAEI